MTKTMRRLVGAIGLLALGACTTTFTESELEERELRDQAKAREEEERNRAIGQEGGSSQMEVDEEAGWADREADL